ncbi:helix-turn-helix domain-containing protein [Streptococcus marmotae]|uniref:helix-turn-helix domain-containing protein n=1 Tax=Streptococcus marmotae TaxID=1825069 RepID=UPI00082DBB1A|nr:helix-turn-helix transcriptional regulator [Streptococcus marmotae]
MRWDYGSVYKEIRRAKQLSQKQVCGNHLNRSTLVRFENNETVPSYEHMHFLLQQVDMTFEEFEYICYSYQPSQSQKLLYEIDNLKFPSREKMEELVSQCQEVLKRQPDSVPIRRRMLVLQAVLELQEPSKNSKDIIDRLLWRELSAYDIWYHNDIRLVGSIIGHFPIETLEIVSDLLLKHLEKFGDYKNIQVTALSLYRQLSNIFLNHHLTEKTQFFAEKTIQLAKEQKRYDYLATGRIYLGLATDDEQLIQSGVDLLTITEEHEWLKRMQHIIDTQKNSSE